MIKLYDVPLSGNCHKVRLMLSFLGIAYETQPIDLQAQDQKTAEYLAMNPLGQVPVLVDDGEVYRDSQAILVYLASRYGADSWLPLGDAKALGVLDGQLAGNDWLVGAGPTVADVANYVYAALVHQGGINPHSFANVSAWLSRFEALDGYIGMAAMPAPK
jgi:glutathione S-transferase